MQQIHIPLTFIMAKQNQTLGEFIIENQSEFRYSSGELSRLINSIRLAAKVVNHEVNKLSGIISSTTSYDNGNAVIQFDSLKTNVSEIETAINRTGYEVTDRKEK